MTLMICCAVPVLAEAPATSLRPVLRPAAAQPDTRLAAQAAITPSLVIFAAPLTRPQQRPSVALSEVPLAQQAAALAKSADLPLPAPNMRPRLRPQASSPQPALAPPTTQIATTAALPRTASLVSVPRPQARPALPARGTLAPERIETVAAVRILPGKSAVIGRRGSVCGDPAIKGEVLAPITSRVRGCGIEDPVRVTSVDGVTLNQAAILNCDTARALKDWVATSLKPAFGRKEVAGLRIAGSYSCRTRNNVRGAPVSEHGRGKAIDISAITLANGTNISVANDWRRSAGKPMKKAYRAACGTFGTTLGPDADRYHRDHMHFDTARQRGGAYCR